MYIRELRVVYQKKILASPLCPSLKKKEKKVTHDMWQVTGDRWRVKCDMWQLTGDRWHVTVDMWQVTHGVGWTFSQNFSSLGLKSYGHVKWESHKDWFNLVLGIGEILWSTRLPRYSFDLLFRMFRSRAYVNVYMIRNLCIYCWWSLKRPVVLWEGWMT